jgi:hypothetical protein
MTIVGCIVGLMIGALVPPCGEREVGQNAIKRRLGVVQFEINLTARDRQRRIRGLEVAEAE